MNSTSYLNNPKLGLDCEMPDGPGQWTVELPEKGKRHAKKAVARLSLILTNIA